MDRASELGELARRRLGRIFGNPLDCLADRNADPYRAHDHRERIGELVEQGAHVPAIGPAEYAAADDDPQHRPQQYTPRSHDHIDDENQGSGHDQRHRQQDGPGDREMSGPRPIDAERTQYQRSRGSVGRRPRRQHQGRQGSVARARVRIENSDEARLQPVAPGLVLHDEQRRQGEAAQADAGQQAENGEVQPFSLLRYRPSPGSSPCRDQIPPVATRRTDATG